MTLDPLAPGLDELVNSQLPESRVVPLDGVGEASAKVFERAGNESRTRPLVAANFWQAYVNSRAYERDLREHSLYQVDVSLVDAQIVADTRGRFTLLVESDKVEDPVTFRASAEPDELEVGWFRANEARDSREQDALRQLLPSQRLWRSPPPAQVRDTWQLTPELSIEAGASQDFFVIVVPVFEEELLSTPSPAATVVALDAAGNVLDSSSAGAIVQDDAGVVGVTAAAHAIPHGATVEVNGRAGNVLVRADGVQHDACFIKLPSYALPQSVPSRGPLRKAPRQNDSVEFDGATSGPVSTVIRSFNYELPFIDPNLQQTVRTDMVTAPGDSGASLVDGDGSILGFSHSRSAGNSVATYSSWIWAAAVFDVLKVTHF